MDFIKAEVVGSKRVSATEYELTLDLGNGEERTQNVPADQAKKYPPGRLVEFALRPVRKPRAKNGEGKKPGRKAKAKEE